MLRSISLLGLSLTGILFAAAIPDPVNPDPSGPRPIDAVDSVFIEELTWMEVRDAQKSGKTTILVATGGIEQNGPYLALGKHNYILRATTEAVARKLGNALVAPIIAFVPEGEIDPPSSHMKYPGSISLTEDTYRKLLTDICASLKTGGFTDIVLIGDSGGNQDGMKAVQEALSAKWAGGKTRVHFIPEYYDYAGVEKFLVSQGIQQTQEGLHDDYGITSQMMVVDPSTVRMKQRIAAGKFTINGVPLAPAEKTIAMGKRVVDYRAGITAEKIRSSVGAKTAK
jgi:creatinine amidohydrolase/Fe(II)-dependent formamide hydrolase-like protein